MTIKWRRRKNSDGSPRYDGEVAHGSAALVVASIVKTGTHLDDYPWDWYFTDHGVRLSQSRHHSGVADSLRAAKREAEYEAAVCPD